MFNVNAKNNVIFIVNAYSSHGTGKQVEQMYNKKSEQK